MNRELNNFLEYLKNKKYNKSTINSYYFGIKDFFDFLLSNAVSCKKFNNDDILKFKNSILTKNSPQTINTKLFAIKKYAEYLAEKENISINFDINPIKIESKKTITPIKSIDKLIAYIDKINKNDLVKNRDKLLIKLLYYTGAKTNDIIKTKSSDFVENVLKFGDKHITLDNNLVNDIKNYLELAKIKNDEFIFFNFSPAQNNIKSNKKNLTEKSVQDIFNRYKKIIGENLSIRDLRNSFVFNNKHELSNIKMHKINYVNTVFSNKDYLQYLKTIN